MRNKMIGKGFLFEKKAIVILISLIVIILTSLGYGYYNYESKRIKKEQYNKIKTIADFKINQVLEWRKERLADAKHFSKSPLYADAIQRIIYQTDTVVFNQITKRNKLIRDLRGFEEVFIYSPTNRMVISSTSSINKIDATVLSLVDSALHTKRIYFSDFYYSSFGKHVRISIIAPIIDSKNNAIATLIFYIDPDTYLFPLIQNWPITGKTNETVLIRDDGKYVTILNRLKNSENIPLQVKIQKDNKRIPIVKVLYGFSGMFEGLDYNGNKVLADLQHISGTNWYTVYKINQSEVYTELYYRGLVITILVIVFIIMFSLGFFLIYYTREIKRKQAEKELNNKTDELEQFFANSMDMLCIVDAEGRFKHLNPEWERSLGYPINELVGRKYIEFLHPDDIEATNNASLQLTNNVRVINFINRYKNKNGTYRWIEWRSYPMNGLIYATARDITEKKQTEEILKEKEILLKDFHKVAKLGAYKYNFITNIWICTDVLDDIFGIDNSYVKDVTGWAQVIHPEYREIMVDYLTNHVVKEGKPFDKEYKILRINDKQERWVHGKGELERDLNGNIVRLIGTIQDITERKNAEETLRTSEHKYRMLFENMTSGFALHEMLYDENGKPSNYKYIEANPAFYRLTGIPDGFMVGKTIKEVIPEIEDHWIQTFGKVALSGEPLYYMNYAKDLGKYYETYVFCPEKDRFAVVFNDATERIKAEEELKLSEKKFADIFNLSPNAVGITILDTGEIIDANEAFTHIVGYTKKEFIGKTTIELDFWFEHDKRDDFKIIIKKKEKVYNYEMLMRTKSGLIKTCLISANHIIFNNKNCIIFTMIDITDLKKTEKELQQARQYNDALLNSIPGLVYLYDAEGHLISWNKRHEIDTGYSAEELSQMTLLDWYKGSEEDIANITAGVQKALIEGFASAEAHLQKKNGQKVLYYFTAVRIEIEGKTFFTGMGMDITERRKAENEIKHLNQNLEKIVEERTTQLQQANKDLEAFAYSVSHDLRSPLRHIDGFVKLLYSNIQNPSESISEYYNKINAASKRMSVMIDDLLSFSRLGRKETAFYQVDMNILVKEIIELNKPDLINRNIEWEINTLPILNGDKNLLKIAFENLINNAIKYTSKKEKARIEIFSNNDLESVYEIVIKDNGVGFDMAYSQKLFGVFQRLHTNEDFEGTGIGLANVKQIITKHKGSIKAEGKINEGATFYITLPK